MSRQRQLPRDIGLTARMTLAMFLLAALYLGFVAVLFVLPVISDALPVSVSSAINPYLPANIGVNVFSPAGVGTNALPPFVGLGVLCAYAAGVLVIGTVLLVRRDA